MMNKQVQVSLFKSIVRYLAGREVVTYFSAERILFKRDDGSSKSIAVFISCDSNSMNIFKTKETTLTLRSFLF